MKLTILGSGPAWPSPGGNSSGYLLDVGARHYLLDCGTGVFSTLREHLPPERVDAIVISHVHFDHWADLIPFRYYLVYEAPSGLRPRLLLPPGALEVISAVVKAVDPTDDFWSSAFRVEEYDPAQGLELGEAAVSFHQNQHPVPTFAQRYVLGDDTFVYSSDTGWDPTLAEFASGADLFLCESSWDARESQGQVHLTARQAGELASTAGVDRLVLTHLTRDTAQEAVVAAEETFRGQVEYAAEGAEFIV